MKIEVAYARPDKQLILSLDVEEGTTIDTAIKKSEILKRFPEIDLSTCKVGLFGKLSKKDTQLRDKDRIEIYRPLIADPKEIRRQRAAEGRTMRKGGGKLS